MSSDHQSNKTYTLFAQDRCLGSGPIATIALLAKAADEAAPGMTMLFFDDETGQEIDLNLRGSEAEVLARLNEQFPTDKLIAHEPAAEASEPAVRGRGRPKLGVVAHEVTLLPRHWEWLYSRPGSPSATLRKLVDEARRTQATQHEQQRARKATFLFISAMAGNQAHFEDANRALFAGDRQRFVQCMQHWPTDIRLHAERLSATAFVEVAALE